MSAANEPLEATLIRVREERDRMKARASSLSHEYSRMVPEITQEDWDEAMNNPFRLEEFLEYCNLVGGDEPVPVFSSDAPALVTSAPPIEYPPPRMEPDNELAWRINEAEAELEMYHERCVGLEADIRNFGKPQYTPEEAADARQFLADFHAYRTAKQAKLTTPPSE